MVTQQLLNLWALVTLIDSTVTWTGRDYNHVRIDQSNVLINLLYRRETLVRILVEIKKIKTHKFTRMYMTTFTRFAQNSTVGSILVWVPIALRVQTSETINLAKLN